MGQEQAEKNATLLLRQWRGGDEEALEQLTPLIYKALRERAGYQLRRERSGNSLQATELANEVFLRLVEADVSWQDRAHFLAVAASSMRRLLIDRARARLRDKRGAGQVAVDFDEAEIVVKKIGPSEEDLLALDAALRELASWNPRKSRLVELSFFGGLTLNEIVEAEGGSKSAVQRELSFAKAWLHRRLSG